MSPAADGNKERAEATAIGEVAVRGVGAFVSGYGGIEAWCEGRVDPEDPKPTAAIVPARQRRRASTLSKALADAYAEALAGAEVDPSQVASVFGAALGEATTMVGLLGQMWGEATMLSPMRFATSVHNAASGMVSIATENRGVTTAIGADFDTPAMALLEGIGLALAREESVLVCCGDEGPPADLVPDGSGWELMTAAILISPPDQAPADCPRLSGLGIEPERTAKALDPMVSASPRVEQNPNIGLLDLAVAVSRGATGVVALDRGTGRGYSIELRAGTAS